MGQDQTDRAPPHPHSTAHSRLRQRWRARLWHFAFLVTRPLTMGVRVVVINEREEIYLVRHGYVPGWHFPGGGVDPGESCLEAMARELAEESPLRIAGPASLHGIFFNRTASRRDHIAVYIVRDFTFGPARPADFEILEGRFFSRFALPEGVSGASLRRIAEIFDHREVSQDW